METVLITVITLLEALVPHVIPATILVFTKRHVPVSQFYCTIVNECPFLFWQFSVCVLQQIMETALISAMM